MKLDYRDLDEVIEITPDFLELHPLFGWYIYPHKPLTNPRKFAKNLYAHP